MQKGVLNFSYDCFCLTHPKISSNIEYCEINVLSILVYVMSNQMFVKFHALHTMSAIHHQKAVFRPKSISTSFKLLSFDNETD